MSGYQQRDRPESRSVLAVNLGGRGVGRALGCCAAAVVCSMLLVGTAASSNAGVQTAGGATGASANKTAKVAVAILPDLGAGWAQYRKAGGVQKLAKGDCVYKAAPTLTAPVTGYAGPMYTDTAKTMFAYSTAMVFRTEADAKAYTTAKTAPVFQNCRVAQDNAAQRKSDPTTFVKLNETTTSAVGGASGLEAYYSENQGGKNAAGADALAAEYLRLTYRHGRVVYTLLIDVGLPSDAASGAVLNDHISAAVEGMNTSIEARLTAAGA